MTDRHGSRRKMDAFARQFVPPGMKWCVWGLHYEDVEHFHRNRRKTLQVEPSCKPCTRRQNQERERRRRKAQATVTREQLLREVRDLRAERKALLARIADERRELRGLQEACVDPSIRQRREADPAPASAEPPTVIPMEMLGLRKRRRRAIAKSYSV